MIYKKAEELLEILTNRGETIAISESCTGGLVAQALTACAGASQIFLGGLVAYSNQVKSKMLGVNLEIIENFGAVSSECAIEMAKGTLELFSTDYAISITGIAGPTGGSIEKPVGLVYISIGDQDFVDVYEFKFYGNRNEIRQQAAVQAYELILEKIKEKL